MSLAFTSIRRISIPHARYFGTELSERSLVPGDDAQLD